MDPRSESIMIVDDVQQNLRLLCEILSDHDYQLRPFSQPINALKSAFDLPPDLILLDVNMPEIDGFEFCKRIKANESTSRIPVIFISAQKDNAGILEGFRHGAVDYITKPFQAGEVISRIQTHLKLQRYQKELSDKNSNLERAMAELKSTQAQLVHAEKMASLGVLTAGIAHEINNPIAFIQANANVMAKRLEQMSQGSRSFGPKEQIDWKHLSEGFLDGSKRIADIVKSLQTYARVDEVGLKEYDPSLNITATLKLFSHRTKRGMNLSSNIQKPEKKLCANPGKINQVFTNLLSNAIAVLEGMETSQEKIIKIDARTIREEDQDWYMIRVEDNGPGLKEGQEERIFDPFYTTKEPGKGLGLGLSIASKLMEEHKGKLRVFRASPGCVFDILIPH
ncbi:sensor histidine kinase [Pelagicoccus albus]|uniref:histidine kinase n=1 Tax=Pelagicoccus albus TaxID=415222 RepID=A0A7X1B656_9BACT|nr:response regulator [Pelagicoccus albus]MBC2606356.1 response regulator [Pelagicoccus albus]